MYQFLKEHGQKLSKYIHITVTVYHTQWDIFHGFIAIFN